MDRYAEWIGRTRTQGDILSRSSARLVAAMLDLEPESYREGVPLPPGWHWFHFLPVVPASRMGLDGHERRGHFLPPVELPRRMWAAGVLRFRGPLRIGEEAVRESRILSIQEKEGRTGPLVLATIRHRVSGSGGGWIEEDQTLIYRGSSPDGGDPSPPSEERKPEEWEEHRVLGPVELFRFSALTGNGHRIHYDHPYTTGEEAYPGLVVHAPFQALLLLQAACRRAGGRPPRTFRFRAISPLFAGEELRLVGGPVLGSGGSTLRAVGPRGVTMHAEVEWGAGEGSDGFPFASLREGPVPGPGEEGE